MTAITKKKKASSTDSENLRVRLTGELKEKFVALAESKNLKQQGAIEALVAWIVEQDELLQSLALGQFAKPMTRLEVARLLLARLEREDGGATGQDSSGVVFGQRGAALPPTTATASNAKGSSRKSEQRGRE